MRLRVIAGVVVKPHLAVAEGADRFAVLDDVGDHHERRVVFAAGRAAVGRAAADVDLAEIAGGADLVGFRQFLIAEHDDDVLIEGVVDGLDGRGIERLAQIDARDCGARAPATAALTDIAIRFLLFLPLTGPAPRSLECASRSLARLTQV